MKRFLLSILIASFFALNVASAIYSETPLDANYVEGNSYNFGDVMPGDQFTSTFTIGDETFVDGDSIQLDFNLQTTSSLLNDLQSYLSIEGLENDEIITTDQAINTVEFTFTIPEGLPKGNHEYRLQGVILPPSGLGGVTIGVGAARLLKFNLLVGTEIEENVELEYFDVRLIDDNTNLNLNAVFNNTAGLEEEIFGNFVLKDKAGNELVVISDELVTTCKIYATCQLDKVFELIDLATIDHVYLDASFYFYNNNGEKLEIGEASYDILVYPQYLILVVASVVGLIILIIIVLFIKKRKKNV